MGHQITGFWKLLRPVPLSIGLSKEHPVIETHSYLCHKGLIWVSKREKKNETLETWFQLLGSTTIHTKSFKTFKRKIIQKPSKGKSFKNLQKENHSKTFKRKIIQKPSKGKSFKTFKRKIIQNLSKENHSFIRNLRPNNKPKVLKISPPYCPQPVVSNRPKLGSLWVQIWHTHKFKFRS